MPDPMPIDTDVPVVARFDAKVIDRRTGTRATVRDYQRSTELVFCTWKIGNAKSCAWKPIECLELDQEVADDA